MHGMEACSRLQAPLPLLFDVGAADKREDMKSDESTLFVFIFMFYYYAFLILKDVFL